ncbi:solid-state culture specific protein [Aspergillus heteromorphus CBS 117.55]|uniref:Solid-state culture specific protein n=1 Tax=Aspergillus heteromorphus CBS 117.55 TaxID=1448321 RepID=A0A317X6W3_9EURO|nr:solid-state culture specific protein [Aspergillus heteromorphus CBS 117.55]PWY92320.1 solid-state culture specific protein [Aspergillus heteromorphus CBS 117.55]
MGEISAEPMRPASSFHPVDIAPTRSSYTSPQPPKKAKSITLDCTLRDLYTLDDDTSSEPVILAYDHPCKFPRDQSTDTGPGRFLYSANFPGISAEEETPNLYKRGVAQRYSFVAGRSPVIMIDLSGDGGEDLAAILSTSTRDAYRVYEQLCPDQRPDVKFVKSLQDVQGGTALRTALIIPQDHLRELPQILDPDDHYEILSKRWLAVCGLPTPPSTVVDPRPVESWGAGQQQHADGTDAEIKRMLRHVEERALPFVVKVSIATSGRGTYVVRSESDRQSALDELDQVLDETLHKLHDSNQSLYPASLVIQELIPGEACGVTFFVTKKGRVVYLAASRQRFDDEGHWKGGCVSYLAQPAYKKRYWNTIETLAKKLHSKGYYGPAGADIMTDETGTQMIVDVNPRVTGSYHLGFLKGHFIRRGMFEAAVLSHLMMRCTRDMFEAQFASEIADGRLIINAWVHDSSGESSYGAVTVGGEDSVRLGRLVKAIETFVETGECAVSAEL